MLTDKSILKKIAIGFASVTELFVLILTGFVIGYYVDNKVLNTKPWLTIIFSITGLIGGFYRVYKTYVRSEQEERPNKSH